MSDRYQLLVFSSPVDGREREYNEWYDERHMPDALKFPGFLSGRRYEVIDASVAAKLPGRYVAVYELECEDPVETLQKAMDRIGSPEMPISEALDLRSGMPVLLRAVGGPQRSR